MKFVCILTNRFKKKEDIMRNIITIGILLCIVIICAGPATAQQKGPAEALAQGLVETVATGCEKELAAYCQGVTPGEGRILAYLVNECGDDLDKHCASVPTGEGRLLDCLDKNEKKVSRRCKQALTDTGLK